MDRRFNWPCDPARRPRQKPTQNRRPRAERRETRANDYPPPARATAREQTIPLVEDDDLFLLPPVAASSGVRPSGRGATATRKFTHAFRGVWEHIPPFDRGLLLGYWHQPTSEVARTLGADPPRRRPLIRLLRDDLVPEGVVAIRQLAHELAFRASVTADRPDRLRALIARALAEAYRVANREHGMLVERLLLLPLEQWEHEHMADAADREYDAIQGVFEEEFLRLHEAAVDEVLRRWGVRGVGSAQ